MKVFLDDYRNPQDCVTYMHKRIGALNPIYLDSWVTVRNYDQFVNLVQGNIDDITHVSFDHDLADEHYISDTWQFSDAGIYSEKTGYDCALWMKQFYEETKTDLPVIFVHSMNPVGTKRIADVFPPSNKANQGE